MYLRLPTTFAVIWGAFTLGLYVAIQGPTLMDLIDMLHVNNDVMSYSMAFASLAYSFGGLVSGYLFNHINRQLLIVCYFSFFGLTSMVTPFVTNFTIFSVINVLKMMCGGGVDCAGNVWILEMWPGKDAWLQALHFSFACGCALGPLIVEPFLSVDYKDSEIDKLSGKSGGQVVFTDTSSNDSRIYVPYIMSGLCSCSAGMYILYLYFLKESYNKRLAKLSLKQRAAAGECILLTSVQHPAAIEAGLASPGQELVRTQCEPIEPIPEEAEPGEPGAADAHAKGHEHQESGAEDNELRHRALQVSAGAPATNKEPQAQSIQQQQEQPLLQIPQLEQERPDSTSPPAPTQPNNLQQAPAQEKPPKITSKSQHVEGQRTPYYVMFGATLAAMCLSFYCGIEITSMNYLATFAINIDLNLTKSTAALMSSALTISFALGRLIGIWIAIFMKPQRLFYLCSALMAIGNITMLLVANSAEIFLWISICAFGIGCGPMFPAIVSFYDEKVSKVTNTVSGVFILGSMCNVALNTVIIGHHIIDNALILIVCNLIGSVILLLLFGTLHLLTRVKRNQRIRKDKLRKEKLRQEIEQQQRQQLLPPPPQAAFEAGQEEVPTSTTTTTLNNSNSRSTTIAEDGGGGGGGGGGRDRDQTIDDLAKDD